MNDHSRIHVWDGRALARALLWAVAFEAVLAGLFLLGRPGASGGAPHNFPDNPLVLLALLFHLPAMIVAALLGLGPWAAFVMETGVVAYVLFVWGRLRKVRPRLG